MDSSSELKNEFLCTASMLFVCTLPKGFVHTMQELLQLCRLTIEGTKL